MVCLYPTIAQMQNVVFEKIATRINALTIVHRTITVVDVPESLIKALYPDIHRVNTVSQLLKAVVNTVSYPNNVYETGRYFLTVH